MVNIKQKLLKATFGVPNDKWGSVPNKKYINFLSSLLRNRPILDCGSGFCWFPADVRIDLEPKVSNVIRMNLDSRLKFKDSSFGSINCHHVLEHVENPEYTLRELHRILKKDGKILIAVPHPNNPGYKIKIHKHFFTEESLKELISKYFSIEKMFGFIGTNNMIFPIFIHKSLGKLIPNEIICLATKIR